MLTLALLLALAAEPAAPADVPAPSAPVPVGAFPSDEPHRMEDHGRRAIELDLYLGPSYSSSGDAGLGIRAAVVNHQATPKNFGVKWFLSGGGGFYDFGPGVGNQYELLGTGEVGVGYLGLTGLEDGTAPLLFVNFLSLSADVLTQVQSIYSYTPNLQIGFLGRDARTSDSWNVHLHLGGNASYVTGELEKLGPSGALQRWLIDPWAQLSALADLNLTSKIFLRLGANLGDTIDFLGPAGVRHIIEARLHAYLKLGPTLYTGPTIVFDDPGRVANPVTESYDPASPSYTITWLLGGALNPG